jgi:hypothetical protein
MRKNLIVLCAFLIFVGFVTWKHFGSSLWAGSPDEEPPSFIVHLRDGRDLKVLDIQYSPLLGSDSYDYHKRFTLNNDLGSLEVFKDLRDIQRIDVLDQSGVTLRVTYPSGYYVEGTRLPGDYKRVADYIHGTFGKQHLNLEVERIASITREPKRR